MTVASPAQTLSLARSRDHIVDVLIAERAPNLAASAAWPFLRPLLYSFLDYGKARRMADAIAPLPGRAALRVDQRPGLLRAQGGLDGLVHLRLAGELDAGLHLAGVGVEDVAEAAGGAGHRGAVDEVADLAHAEGLALPLRHRSCRLA